MEERRGVARQAFDLIHAIHKDLDYMETTLEFMLGGNICVAGCGKCCRQSIIVTEISAQYIVHNLKSLPRQDKIAAQLKEWLLFSIPGVRHNFSKDGQAEKDARQWEYSEAGHLYCPFIDEGSKHCLIYPWRDPSCRAWGVTRVATELCPRPIYEGEDERLRHYVGSDNHLVSKVSQQTELLRDLLQKSYPEGLRRGWLPTLVYRLLAGQQEWQLIQDQVQEVKIAKYEGDLLWIVTQEEVVRHVNKEDILATAIPYS